VLHRAGYRALGLAGWSYAAIDCDQRRLPGLLAGCGPEWAGLSLTMPLKRAVLPLLDDTEPLAAEVGAANTVIFSDGARRGHNTDVPGMITALAAAGIRRAAPALVLGAGATACAALAALRGLGTREAAVAVRDPARARQLRAAAGRLGVAVRLIPFGGFPADPGGLLLISAVPGGAADTYAERMAAAGPVPAAVLEVVYQPWPTRLAAAAAAAGATVIGGFELLLHQAAGQLQLMTGRAAPVPAMRAAGLAALRRRAHPGTRSPVG
jgi:shikimate dehydrogenase